MDPLRTPPGRPRRPERRRRRALCALLAVLGLAVPCGTASAAMPRFSHVIVVVLENRAFGDFPGKSNAPWINGTLMKRYAYATRVFVTTHNSPTAYYALASGKPYEGGDGGSWAGSCVTATKTCSTD